MRYLLPLIFLLTFNVVGFSQTKTQYLDEYLGLLPDKNGAAYYRTTQFADKKKDSQIITTYYITGEKFKEDKTVKNQDEKFLPEGLAQKWYQNGQLFYTAQYKQGKPEGEALGYYPSGKLKRRENFVNGKLEKGECFNEDGTPADYYPHRVEARFPGGPDQQKLFVRSNLKYPADALRNGKEGTVTVKVLIDKTGKMVSWGVINSIYPALDAEALRVVMLMPDFEPASEEGVPTAYAIHLPFRFRLDGGRQQEPFRRPNNSPRRF